MATEIRRNLSINPSGETGGGWITNSGALYPTVDDTNIFHSGTKSKKSSPGGATIGLLGGALISMYGIGGATTPATVGKQYTASVYGRHNVATAVDSGMRMLYGWTFLDSGSVGIGGVVYAPMVTGWSPNIWNRAFLVTGIAPANAVYLRTIFQLQHATNIPADANDAAWVDDSLIEEGIKLGDYFDGNSAAGGGVYYQWLGTVNASMSVAMEPGHAGISQSRNDTIYASLVAGGYGPGSLVTMEYKRLLSKAGLVAPQRLSLDDLYKRNNERPRLY